ncbi:MAG: NAD(P)/FAD-dependent oxidoreductase [Trueperaceae bacterium]|nr:NAD(P)/FAD-dependent oxidoreductase [Trueperaceae bacterium]
MSHIPAPAPAVAGPQARPRVVVIGAGFAGLEVVKGLKRAPVEVLLLDQHNHHTFQPLLYQVATAQLEAGDVAHQVRAVLRRQANARFRQGTVTDIDGDAKEVVLVDGARIGYDQLVIAPGAIYEDFGTPGVRRHAFFLKSLTEAVNLRSHVLRCFETAAQDPSTVEEGMLTFVITGAGPTGVEMAGALAELFQRVLPGDYPELDLSRARIVLLEMTDAVLPPFSAGSQRHALWALERRGVDVRLGTAVRELRGDGAVLADGSFLPSRTLLWAAGVRAHPLVEAVGAETTRGGRLVVEDDLALPGRPDVWAAGDVAASQDREGRLHPQLAPVAIQHGQHLARQIRARLEGRATAPFTYANKGIMAIIGRNAGVAELSPRLGGLKVRGFAGWLAWLFLHLAFLPGHKNRIGAFTSWAYEYLTFDRHARLIGEMVPSPAEITGRTGAVVAADTPARASERTVEQARRREEAFELDEPAPVGH